MRSPGRTITRSPVRTSAIGTSMSRPSRRTRAVDGCSLASCRSARVVLRLRARLHRVAEQHQRDDDDDRFVVDVGARAVRRRTARAQRWPRPNTGTPRRCRSRSACSCRRCDGGARPGAHVEVAPGPRHHERPSRRAARGSASRDRSRRATAARARSGGSIDAHRPAHQRIAGVRRRGATAAHQRHRREHRDRAEEQADERLGQQRRVFARLRALALIVVRARRRRRRAGATRSRCR